MLDSPAYQRLVEALGALGIRTVADRDGDGAGGFPVVITLPEGHTLAIDLPMPALISSLDPDSVGVVILDHLGYPRKTWGIADRIPYFERTQCVFETDIAPLIEGAYREVSGSLYYQGYRYYAAPLNCGDLFEVLVLVTDANEEQSARRQASRSKRDADALKKIGRALTMNQTLQPLSVAAVHAIASTTELAAVLLWTRTTDEGPLELIASVGANRAGLAVMGQLNPEDGMTCAAELVAARRQPLSLASVGDNAMTTGLEASFCYLKPGGMAVHPLIAGHKLVGVLELIGREGDHRFCEHEELFRTIADHLSLALNSALMFESVERLASFDPLTGIANHRTMQEFLHRRVAEAERGRDRIGVIMLDVDHFRSFNEEEGHDAGDQVLQMFTQVLKDTVRPYDLAARYGGEEFTVIMPGVDLDGAFAVAERIRSQIENLTYTTQSGRLRHVTASLGCSAYPDTALDPAGLLKAADVALFRAKRAGRNRTEVYEGALRKEPHEPAVDIAAVARWLRPRVSGQSHAFLGAAQPYVAHLVDQLGLSKSQEEILTSATLLTPSYLRAVEHGDERLLARMAKAPELRSVMPCLQALGERYDGRGPKSMQGAFIPLLSRVLCVLVALLLEHGDALCQDPGRFDPEVVGLVAEVEDAA